jgi:hypothetical protein
MEVKFSCVRIVRGSRTGWTARVDGVFTPGNGYGFTSLHHEYYIYIVHNTAIFSAGEVFCRGQAIVCDAGLVDR